MRVATHGGDDGSDLVVRSIAEARRCLKDGGRLLLLLPHWSNVERAWDELRKHYTQVTELSRKQVEFFPIREGKPDEELIHHVRKLAGEGVIEMTFESEIPQSWVSVVECLVKKMNSDSGASQMAMFELASAAAWTWIVATNGSPACVPGRARRAGP